MNFLGFSEGARDDTGGFGIVSVPMIHKALADRGHHDALMIGGRAMPSATPMLRRSVDDIFASANGSSFGAVEFPAYGRWSYAPGLYTAASARASSTHFVFLHSLYSYPVLAGSRLARRFDIPYAIWPHGVFAPIQRRVGALKKALYGSMIANRIVNSAAVLFYTATGERDQARALNLRPPSVIIPHGFDTSEFATLPTRGAFRQRYLNGHTGPVVLYLGRLNIKKGLDLLAAAMASVFRQHPDARLAIVGGGHPPEFAKQVEGWVRDAGIADRTVMTGPLSGLEKRQAFADCDVFAMPSHAENFGFSLFEAMACGRPVVCSDTLNLAAAVDDANAGLAVARTSEAMAGAFNVLLSDAARRAAFGINGQKLASRYSWEACAERVETAIRCVREHQPFPRDLQPE